jgi:hypothetical protein
MNLDLDDDMKPEYDFSRAERGKHYAGADAVLHIPVYLEQEVQAFLIARAAINGVRLDRLEDYGTSSVILCPLETVEPDMAASKD